MGVSGTRTLHIVLSIQKHNVWYVKDGGSSSFDDSRMTRFCSSMGDKPCSTGSAIEDPIGRDGGMEDANNCCTHT